MKKIIFASIIAVLLFGVISFVALAEDNQGNSNNLISPLNATTTYATPYGDCVVPMIEKRDAAIVTALNTYNAGIVSAINTRTAAFKAAWGISDRNGRRTALKKVWQDYRATRNQLRKDSLSARQDAWKVFNNDRKTCNSVGSGRYDDTTGYSGMDLNI